ncbi:MAG: recombinase family protein [Candidatus Nanopelagicales bacterium]
MRVIGYVRLSRDTKGGGHSLDAQQGAISDWCRNNGHTLVTVIAEVASAKDANKLHGRRLAIASIKAGVAEAMVVRDLDRVTRSTLDGAALLEDARVNEWRLIGAVDGLDTDDDEQGFTINIRIAVAQEERRKIARRTRDGLASASRRRRAEGKPGLGKPRQIAADLEARIAYSAANGLTPYRIAKALDAEGVPTPQGGKLWSPSVVRDVIRRNGVQVGG